MKRFYALVLMLCVLFQASATAMPATHPCCGDADCSMVQCLEMGCASASAPMAAASVPLLQHVCAASEAVPYVQPFVSNHIGAIFVPPD